MKRRVQLRMPRKTHRAWGAETLRCAVILSLLRGARGQSPCTLYEAEDATASNTDNPLRGPSKGWNHEGYTGSGFMDYGASSGDYLEWNVWANATWQADATWQANATWRYALSGNNRDLSLSVNGDTVTIPTVRFPGTEFSWRTYKNTTSVVVTLRSGSNTIRLTANGASGANLDSMTLCSWREQL